MVGLHAGGIQHVVKMLMRQQQGIDARPVTGKPGCHPFRSIDGQRGFLCPKEITVRRRHAARERRKPEHRWPETV